VRQRPDWICEVSHTTWKKDTTTVLQTLQSEGVPYYWIADVDKMNLLVFELVGNQYALAQSLFPDSGRVRIKPFDAIELSVPVLFGAEED
jgi:Uma2 family endonuclease